MAAFNYRALDANGRQKKGTLEADSPRQVRQLLREKGLNPLSVEAGGGKRKKSRGGRGRKGLSVNELSLITRQLATLIQSGIPVVEALNAVSQQNENAAIRSMMLAIRSKVMEGYTLADSLSDYPRAFPRLYCSTVAAGEAAGHLDLILNRLADYTESQQQARQKIQLAAIYPLILTFVSIGIVVFLLTYVVPDIIEVFVNSGQQLPTLTRIMVQLSDLLRENGLFLLAGIGAFIAVFRMMMRRPAFRFAVHRKLLELPFLKKITRGVNTARYASTLSILSSSGVPLVDAMRIAGEVLSNDCLRAALKEATRQVSEGSSLKVSLENTGYFPPMMLHMVASGEASGELDEMLARTAQNQENDLSNLVATVVGLFEPLMLFFMGGVVLIIVLAIMLPILSLSNLVG